ncbi:MAG: hypothetical protein AB7I33_17215 [Gemmatimonadales bacterium]
MADSVNLKGENIQSTLDIMRQDPVFDSMYTVLNEAPEWYDVLGTELVPSHPMNEWHPGGGFSGQTLTPSSPGWDGWKDYRPFVHSNTAGTVIVGRAGRDPGNTLGHELVHLLQLHDGRDISGSINAERYQRLFNHFPPNSHAPKN